MTLGRFAPSPSGRMHLGNVFAALLAWLSARSEGGRVLLRIEDLDAARCRTAYADLLKDDLAWLGLDWDAEAPLQSTRTEAYLAVLARFEAMGLIYPCWCTRGTLSAASAPHASDGHNIYPGLCRNLSDSQRGQFTSAPSLRLMVPDAVFGFVDGVFGYYEENLKTQCGDFVVRKADGTFAYQLAVVADDIQAGVTQVVRGRDLISSTPRQLYLYRLLNAHPPRYYHTPLLLAPDGHRLSKREKDMDMGVLRKKYSPENILGRLAFLTGLIDKEEALPAQALISIFSWEKVRKEDITITEF